MRKLVHFSIIVSVLVVFAFGCGNDESKPIAPVLGVWEGVYSGNQFMKFEVKKGGKLYFYLFETSTTPDGEGAWVFSNEKFTATHTYYNYAGTFEIDATLNDDSTELSGTYKEQDATTSVEFVLQKQ